MDIRRCGGKLAEARPGCVTVSGYHSCASQNVPLDVLGRLQYAFGITVPQPSETYCAVGTSHTWKGSQVGRGVRQRRGALSLSSHVCVLPPAVCASQKASLKEGLAASQCVMYACCRRPAACASQKVPPRWRP